jgi:hypothetical protein
MLRRAVAVDAAAAECRALAALVRIRKIPTHLLDGDPHRHHVRPRSLV